MSLRIVMPCFSLHVGCVKQGEPQSGTSVQERSGSSYEVVGLLATFQGSKPSPSTAIQRLPITYLTSFKDFAPLITTPPLMLHFWYKPLSLVDLVALREA
jgi:hypothetical protein